MIRTYMKFIEEWLESNDRKPLVLRGARQVGKTWLVRDLAQSSGRTLIEINFEQKPQLFTLFASNEPQQILLNLGSAFGTIIDPKNSILFLDEIQATPEILAKLRWFYEDMPELPVIAAGSLLEFVLGDHTFSMPVGRIEYMHIEPLSFEEFLLACDKKMLVEYIKAYQWKTEIPIAIHEQLMLLFKEYIIVGGMPKAVLDWSKQRSLQSVSKIQNSLLTTYRDDFAKYSKSLPVELFDDVMMTIPDSLGKKIVYSKMSPSFKIHTIKQALMLLCKARVCHRVSASAATGVPLAAQIQDKYFKAILLDVGLCSAALGLSYDQLITTEEIDLINTGGIAEQVVGQLLRTIYPYYIEPRLYYWDREKRGSQAELDYVIQHGSKVIPIEVKAGSTGSLKSLHLFMGLREFPIAIRVNSAVPTQTNVPIKDQQGNPINYKLLSFPFYLLSETHRLIENAIK